MRLCARIDFSPATVRVTQRQSMLPWNSSTLIAHRPNPNLVICLLAHLVIFKDLGRDIDAVRGEEIIPNPVDRFTELFFDHCEHILGLVVRVIYGHIEPPCQWPNTVLP